MQLEKLLKMAVTSIWSNKLRSFLTMLGIIIGISSVIVLVGIGQGTKQQVQSQIESLGTNLITINITGYRHTAFSTSDLNQIKAIPKVKEIAPVITSNVNVKAGTKSYSTSLAASTAEYSEVRKIYTGSGRFINQMDNDNRFQVAVVGTYVAKELYGTSNVVGQTININGVDFQIVGVLQSQGSSMTGTGDDQVILPLSTAERLVKNTQIRTFYIEAADKDSVNSVMSYLQLFLNKKFNNDTESYRIFNQSSLLDTVNQSTNSLSLMLGGIAAISLVVGGIGIMNIMLVSVIERTREIGIRKAIGAKRRTILAQFLIESASISLLGGILGVAMGFALASVLKSLFSFNIVISGNVVTGAVAFSMMVGIIFGIYPANKASKLNPIEALRYE
jgi:putative ABC transport system permease protein